MRLTVFFILCMQETWCDVQTNARKWLIPGKKTHPLQEWQANKQRRLDSNNSATSFSAGVDVQRIVIKAGEIVGGFLCLLIIVVIMITKIISWNTVGDVPGDLQTKDEDKEINQISRSTSLIIVPVDEEELRQVLSEYERLSALLKHPRSDDFTRSTEDVSIFRKTLPVVTPFVRKPLKLVPGNKSPIVEHMRRERESSSIKYLFSIEEKYLVCDSETSVSAYRDQVDNKSPESTKRDKFFVHKQEKKLHITRNQSNGGGNETGIVDISPKRSSIQLRSIIMPSSLPESHEYDGF